MGSCKSIQSGGRSGHHHHHHHRHKGRQQHRHLAAGDSTSTPNSSLFYIFSDCSAASSPPDHGVRAPHCWLGSTASPQFWYVRRSSEGFFGYYTLYTDCYARPGIHCFSTWLLLYLLHRMPSSVTSLTIWLSRMPQYHLPHQWSAFTPAF